MACAERSKAMKRTLTAAATLVASSAGAVGFAGTAAAAPTQELPLGLPTDNGVTANAQRVTGAVQNVAQTVGTVVPAQELPAGRSAGTATGGLPLADLLKKTPVGSVLGGLPLVGGGGGGESGAKSAKAGDALGTLPVGDVVPMEQQSGQDPVGTLLGGNRPDGNQSAGNGDPLGGALGGAGSLPLNGVSGAKSASDSGPLGHLPVDDVTQDLTDGELTSALPIGKNGSSGDQGGLNDILGQTPLGQFHTLGSN
jgi:hypothetical protein